MNRLCRLFGHKLETGYAGGTPYLWTNGGPVDGLDTWHARLMARCARCEEKYHIANLHVPKQAHRNWPKS